MNNILDAMSLRGDTNNNTTFCNIYTKDGIALTDAVLGGLASEDNLLSALEHAEMSKGYSWEQVKEDFEAHHEGYVSFSYNGIQETLYYVPVQRTDWMLSYLIRESIFGAQIQSVSDSIISRSVAQSLLTALALIAVFSVLVGQLRRNSRITLEKEVSDTENRVRHPEDRAGHVVHAVGAAFADIDSEMRESMAKNEILAEALKAAEDASRAKSRFVSDMSHEIRTPITAILGMNEMIHRECEDKTILGYSDTIEKAGNSLLGIISDILDFSKIESGKMQLVNVCYSLPSMISDLYNLIYFRADGKGLEVDLDIDDTLPRSLYGDELRVKQIIANLLTNAVKYTDEPSGHQSSFKEIRNADLHCCQRHRVHRSF